MRLTCRITQDKLREAERALLLMVSHIVLEPEDERHLPYGETTMTESGRLHIQMGKLTHYLQQQKYNLLVTTEPVMLRLRLPRTDGFALYNVQLNVLDIDAIIEKATMFALGCEITLSGLPISTTSFRTIYPSTSGYENSGLTKLPL